MCCVQLHMTERSAETYVEVKHYKMHVLGNIVVSCRCIGESIASDSVHTNSVHTNNEVV